MRLPFDGNYQVTQVFGVGSDYSKSCRADGTHNGVDFATPTGTPIVAAEAGVVTRADMDGTGYGIHVRVKNSAGGGCIYGHLKKATVKVGQKVSAGEQVGLSGNTGNSTGPHLHWEYRGDITKCNSCKDPLGIVGDAVGDQSQSDPSLTLPSGGEGTKTTATGVVNVRLGPSLRGKVIGQLDAGDALVWGCGETIQADGHRWRPMLVYVAEDVL